MKKTKPMVNCKIFPSLVLFLNYGSRTMCSKYWNIQQRCSLCKKNGNWLEVFSSVKKIHQLCISLGQLHWFNPSLSRKWSWPSKEQKAWVNAQVKHVNCPMPLPTGLEYSHFTRQRSSLERNSVKKCHSIVIDLYVATYSWLYVKTTLTAWYCWNHTEPK